MKAIYRPVSQQRVIAALALLLLLVATQTYTQDAGDWFLLGLNIMEASGFYAVAEPIPSLPDVAKVGGSLMQFLQALIELLHHLLTMLLN